MNRRLPAFLLLLTVWLHTVLSVPWHHAQHVAEVWPNTPKAEALWADEGTHQGTDLGVHEHTPDEHHHGLCAWCTALAHAALGTFVLRHEPALRLTEPLPCAAQPSDQGRKPWRQAWARAPPTAT